jgi:hypothetical protein
MQRSLSLMGNLYRRLNTPLRMLFLGLTAVGIAVSAGARGASAAAATKKATATISGTLSAPAPGPCPGTGYESKCAVGPCFHFTLVGNSKISGTFGSGNVSELCITQDDGASANGLVTEGGTPGNNTCEPAFGSMTLQGKSKTGSADTQVDIVGSFCWCQVALGGTKIAFQGGFGIVGAGSTDSSETGWGTLTGTIDHPSQKFTFKLSGSVSP